ncbi:MAG: hypothetical protein JWN89_162 [Parcubacteria group bacterium]|nr:hypothetical protein [Parcubacteria group bacterium]
MNKTFADVKSTFRTLQEFSRTRRANRSQPVINEFDEFVIKLLQRLNKKPSDIPNIQLETPLLDAEPGNLAVIQNKLR